MLVKIKNKIKKSPEAVALSILILILIISTTYYNFNKEKILSNYKNLFYNVYLKKTANHIFNNLEPKFKKIEHKIKKGETFDQVLKMYFVSENEISEIKKNLSKEVNLDKLNTSQKISITIDQSKNLVKEFPLPSSYFKTLVLGSCFFKILLKIFPKPQSSAANNT